MSRGLTLPTPRPPRSSQEQCSTIWTRFLEPRPARPLCGRDENASAPKGSRLIGGGLKSKPVLQTSSKTPNPRMPQKKLEDAPADELEHVEPKLKTATLQELQDAADEPVCSSTSILTPASMLAPSAAR